MNFPFQKLNSILFQGNLGFVNRRPIPIAITGYGLVTAMGTKTQDIYVSLCEKPSNPPFTPVRIWDNTDFSEYSQKEYAATVPDSIWSPTGFLGEYDGNPRRTPRHVAMGLSAAHDAFNSSKLDLDVMDGTRMGISFGSGSSGIQDIASIWDHTKSGNQRKVSPYSAPNILPNAATSRIAIQFGIQGPNLTPSTACAASSHAVVDGIQALTDGSCDVFLAGGSESCVHPVTFTVFHRAQALARFVPGCSEAQNSTTSKPFDTDRRGFVLGEGAGAIILERLDSAIERSADILAVITGYGLSGDAYHVTSPHPKGTGAFRSMKMAWNQTLQLESKAQLSYINAHATSTPMGDIIEVNAISSLIQYFIQKSTNNSLSSINTSSFKGGLGHLLGSSGIVELILTAYAMKTGDSSSGIQTKLPGTLTLENLDPMIQEVISSLDPKLYPTLRIPQEPIVFDSNPENRSNFAITNSFGFGGTNVSIALTSSLLAIN